MQISRRQHIITFSLLLGVVGLLVLLIFLPFLKLLAIGGILTVLFSPIHQLILKKVKNETWAAFFALLIIILVVLAPLYLIGQVLFNELVGLYGRYENGGFFFDKAKIIQSLPPSAQDLAAKILTDLSQKISGFVSGAFTGAVALLSNVGNFIVSLFLVFFTTYYLLRDNKKIKVFIDSIFQLSAERENILTSKLETAISGVIKGSFLVALIQGSIATVGFLIFGVPQPFLWGLFTVVAALVPNFGTSLSLIPAVIYLILTGQNGQAVGMAIWGMTAVGLIDNIVGPKLVGSKSNVHPLLILFSVIGGIQFFGYIGFLLGPILMAIFVALLEIYRLDLREYFKK